MSVRPTLDPPMSVRPTLDECEAYLGSPDERDADAEFPFLPPGQRVGLRAALGLQAHLLGHGRHGPLHLRPRAPLHLHAAPHPPG